MKKITAKISGIGPMLMHSDRLSDPLSELSKKHKELTSDRTLKKTEEGLRAIAKSEYVASFYLDSEGVICLPCLNIRKSLIQGARHFKGGKEVERGVVFLGQYVPLVYDGPKTPDGLWENPRFVDSRSVVVNRSRLIRYRPVFPEWSVTVDVAINDEIINPDNLARYWETAGSLEGIGDFRPFFGKYEVVMT